jgi:hypothetical protein
MRRTAVLVLVLFAAGLVGVPALAAGRRSSPVTVLVAATVADSAKRTMPPTLWLRLITDYVNASKVIPFTGAAAPTRDDCRAAGALYLVNATFELAPRLPGAAQDSDRKYATARIDLLNCLTGVASPTRNVRFESDPLSNANAGDFEPNVEFTWARPVRDKLARETLELSGVARIVRIDGPFLYIDGAGSSITVNQILHIFADKNAQARPPVEMVVTDTNGRFIQATYDTLKPGIVQPQVGDFVEPNATASPTPTPRK